MEDNSDLISCSYCERKFSHRKNMYAHVKKFHPGASIDYKKKLNHRCCSCDDTFISMSVLLSHIRQKHTDVKLIFEKKLFYSMEDFEKWKSEVEKETQSYFAVHAMGENLANERSFMHFRCNRSGNFKSVSSGIRRLKCAGSLKIGKTCPAHMVLYKTTADDLMEIEVHFQSVHMGHKFEIGWLRLTSAERNLIAAEMLQGVPKSTVLTKIQKSFSPTKRLNFITNKDLHNICRDKKIDINEGISIHQKNANFIDINLQQLMNEEGNPILLCMPVVKKSFEEEKASLRIQFEEALQKCVNSDLLNMLKEGVDVSMAKISAATSTHKPPILSDVAVQVEQQQMP